MIATSTSPRYEWGFKY